MIFPDSPAAQLKFDEAFYRIANMPAAYQLWERVLTPDERERLGPNFRAAYEQRRAIHMWRELRGVSPERAVLDVGLKLNMISQPDYEWLLREMGEPVDVEDVVDRAIRLGHLVLIENARNVYWLGDPINVRWDKSPQLWDFIIKLAECGKANRSVCADTFGERASRSIVASRKYRLTKEESEFPVSLADMIQPGARGEQRLMVPPEHIRVFHSNAYNELFEWRP